MLRFSLASTLASFAVKILPGQFAARFEEEVLELIEDKYDVFD